MKFHIKKLKNFIKLKFVITIYTLIVLFNPNQSIKKNKYQNKILGCPSISNCEKMNPNCSCIECSDGYITNKERNICFKKKKNCINIDLKNGKCSKCEDESKFILGSTTGECIYKINNCEKYDELQGTCVQCQEGFFLGDPYSCQTYIKGCFVYTKIEPLVTIQTNNNGLMNRSNKSKSSLDKMDNKSEGKIVVCDKCADGMILSENKNACYQLIEHCIDFDTSKGRCNKCEDRFILNVNNSICFHQIDYCEEHDTTSLVCSKCIVGFIQNNTKEKCFETKPNCVKQSIINGECEQCSYLNASSSLDLGYHLYKGSCYPDILGCISYKRECISCSDEFFLVESSNLNLCVSNEKKIEKCIEYGKSDFTNSIVCVTCFKGYDLDKNSKCVSIESTL